MIYTKYMAATMNKLLRLPTDLFTYLAEWASEEDRSVNNLIVHVLRQAAREHQERKRAVA